MRTIPSHVQERMKAIANGKGLDWATAEALAWGTLMLEGHSIRCVLPRWGDGWA